MYLFLDRVGELMDRFDPEHLVSIDLAFVCNNVSSPWSKIKRLVFLYAVSKNGSVGDVDGGESYGMNTILLKI